MASISKWKEKKTHQNISDILYVCETVESLTVCLSKWRKAVLFSWQVSQTQWVQLNLVEACEG